MTTDTTNHAARALDLLDAVHSWQSQEGSTDATQFAEVIEAQVHATLAVAAEAHTSNLIARAALMPGTPAAQLLDIVDARLGL